MKRSWFVISVLVFLFAAVAYITAPYPTADFYDNFYKAARYVLSGHSPYDSIYIGAPWGVIPLIPFALLPPQPAHGLYFATCLFILVYIAWRLHASPLTIVAFILSPTVIGVLLVGNLDKRIARITRKGKKTYVHLCRRDRSGNHKHSFHYFRS